MQNKEIEELLSCDNCKLNECISCEITWNDRKKMREYIDQLENKVKELEITKDEYLQKLVYALTPTTHELSTDNNNAFKQIIADNIDLETCKIKRKLKEFWGIDKY